MSAAPASGLKQRVLTGLVLAPLVVAGVLLLPTAWLALICGVVFTFGLVEWARLIGLQSQAARLALVALNAALMIGLWVLQSKMAYHLQLAAGTGWWLLLAPIWLGHYAFGATPTRSSLLVKALAGTVVVVPAWVAIVVLHGSSTRGPEWVLFVLLLIWCADSAAFFAGRRFGTIKLAPRISPGKTRAGAWGALAGCAAFAALGGWWLEHQGWPLLALILLSMITVVYSIVGDLFESLIKRHSNVKDSGSIFPGHGGIFDRCDSLFAALPVFTFGKLLIGL